MDFAGSSNGRTPDSESGNLGSNPGPEALQFSLRSNFRVCNFSPSARSFRLTKRKLKTLRSKATKCLKYYIFRHSTNPRCKPVGWMYSPHEGQTAKLFETQESPSLRSGGYVCANTHLQLPIQQHKYVGPKAYVREFGSA